MTDKPDNQEGQQPGAEDGLVNQDEIDALLAGGADASDTEAAEGSADSAPAASPAEPAATPAADEGPTSQEDIDALIAAAGGELDAATGEGGAEPPAAEQAVDRSEQATSQEEIDALLAAAAGGDPAANDATPAEAAAPQEDARLDSMGRPFDEFAAAMQAAIEDEQVAPASQSTASVQADPFEIPSIDASGNLDFDGHRVSMLNDVKLKVQIELGRTRMLVEDVLRLGEGSVVELEKLAGDPVDVFVNGRLIARGEVLVLNDNFCVRISEVVSNDPHRVMA